RDRRATRVQTSALPTSPPAAAGEDVAAPRDPFLRPELGPREDALEVRDQLLEEAPEDQVVRPVGLRLPAPLARLALELAEEGNRAAVADEGCEALVEGDLARDEERVVRQLVDDRGDEGDVVVAQQRREERVVEPAEGAEGARRPEVRVVPLALKLRRGAPGGLHVEEPLVGDAAHDGEPPGDRLEPVAVGRRDDEGEGVAIDPRI